MAEKQNKLPVPETTLVTPEAKAGHEQTLAEWYEEDAKRLNELGDLAVKRGHIWGSISPLPKLNPDGSLAAV